MNKVKSKIQAKTGDTLAVLVYFMAGIISLNLLEQSLVSHLIGIAMLIASLYGVVCISKKKKFLFG